MTHSIQIKNTDALSLLDTFDNNTVDLILTDPPYIISKDSGMNKHYDQVKENEEKGGGNMKSDTDWIEFKKNLKKPQDELDADKGKGWSKENYLHYGSILGKKYATQTYYGKWDEEFTLEQLDNIVEQYYKKLRKGGTVIIWFDFWKITPLCDILQKHKFKQLRIIEWVKTNPQPINSSVNYLSNAREIAILAVKGGKPTFNSKYDKGIYEYPMAAGKYKVHPTQKNVNLFKELIKKHSNENDIVVDTFLGGGTTALACLESNRNFVGCEIDPLYFDKIKHYSNIH